MGERQKLYDDGDEEECRIFSGGGNLYQELVFHYCKPL
jgi:hypothetical protein